MNKVSEVEEDNKNECFHDSFDRLLSSANTSCSSSEGEAEAEDEDRFPMCISNYDLWISEPSSIQERRLRLFHQMGITPLHHRPSLPYSGADLFGSHGLSINSNNAQTSTLECSVSGIVRSKSDGDSNSSISCVVNNSGVLCVNSSESIVVHSNGNSSQSRSLCDDKLHNYNGSTANESCNVLPVVAESEVEDGSESVEETVCTIKNLDNGKQFVVNEVREDGMMWNKLKEVSTGKQLTMEEFDVCVGTSPIVQELMRRQNVEQGHSNNLDCNTNGIGGSGSNKTKKRGSWLKSIRNVASSVTGHKERRSSDERDTSSEKGGRRSSSATDDSQDISLHGPERVRVRQYGKSSKELTAMYKSQDIQAHNGSIWAIQFSFDGKYLASAGEDRVIHIRQVTTSETKGDLLLDKPEDGNLNLLFSTNESPDPATMSPTFDGHLDKKRRGRSSTSRKSMGFEHVLVPETVFALSEKPICSFEGHLDDVLDLSWSKSQQLLSSSMDKTVRLWELSSKSCLKIFSHSDYVTCIQFNPVDDRYFISGSLDAKVRIWSIPERQVVDWNDLHEMVTAACYTPDGRRALVGSYKGSCHLYNTSDNKLQQKAQINLHNKKKRAHKRKITGFQFVPGSTSQVLITSADSRIRVVDGADLVHKFKGFRNTSRHISGSMTADGRYVVCPSEDSHVYIWKHEGDSQPSRNKGVTVTQSYEHFHSQDVSVAVPWPGMSDTWRFQTTSSGEQSGHAGLDKVSTTNYPPTPVQEIDNECSPLAFGCGNSPLHGTISSATNSYFFDRISATRPEEKLLLATKYRSPRVSTDASIDLSSDINQSKFCWGLVIVAASHRGEIRTFQNFGLPIRISSTKNEISESR